MNETLPTREELIALCEKAIVPQDKWSNRDSESAQQNIGRCCQLLKCGCKFQILTKENHPNYCSDEETWKLHFWVHNFNWFENYTSDENDGYRSGSDGKLLTFFIPTNKALKKANGDDWY